MKSYNETRALDGIEMCGAQWKVSLVRILIREGFGGRSRHRDTKHLFEFGRVFEGFGVVSRVYFKQPIDFYNIAITSLAIGLLFFGIGNWSI